MFVDDDDGGGTKSTCGCEEGKHVSCFGCGACYNLLLDIYNAAAKKDKTMKYICDDFVEEDELTDSEYGTVKWFCPECEKVLRK